MEETRIIRDAMLELQDRDASNTVIREYAWGLNLGGGISGLLNIRQDNANYHPLYDEIGTLADTEFIEMGRGNRT